MDRDRAKVYFAANLRWADLPLREILRDRLGLPVIVENDANAAAWGEYLRLRGALVAKGDRS